MPSTPLEIRLVSLYFLACHLWFSVIHDAHYGIFVYLFTVEVSYVNNPAGNIKLVGKTSIIKAASNNPIWNDVITFNWDPTLDQRLRFRVRDADKITKNDNVGEAWLQLQDYVAKGQNSTVILSNGG